MRAWGSRLDRRPPKRWLLEESEIEALLPADWFWDWHFDRCGFLLDAVAKNGAEPEILRVR